MSQANLKLVESLYQAFGRGDIPGVLATMSPDFRWVPAEHSPYDRGMPYVGTDEVAQHVFMRIGVDWDDFVVLPDRFLDAGDTIIMEGRYGGTYKSTGRKTNAQVIHIWVVRDGKLSEFRQYTDTAELREVSGRSNQQAASE
jgi:ketosteroid isomerase-like protein